MTCNKKTNIFWQIFWISSRVISDDLRHSKTHGAENAGLEDAELKNDEPKRGKLVKADVHSVSCC